MRNTPERLKALDTIVLAVKLYNEHVSDTGYQVSRHTTPDNKFLHLRIHTPKDDEYAAYPEVYFESDWYGTGMILGRHEPSPNRYPEHCCHRPPNTRQLEGSSAGTGLGSQLWYVQGV